MPSSAVSAVDLAFTYREGLTVFASLSFSFEAGSIVEIRGGNGSGKSTLMKLVGGLLEPSAGQLLVGLRAPFGLSTKDRIVAVRYVPQRVYEFFLYESIAAEWRATARMGNLLQEALESHLVRFHVDSPREMNPNDLPELEAWRLVLMLCAATDPKVLLIDEVPSYSSTRCISALSALADERRARKLSTVIATHREIPIAAPVDLIVQLPSGPQQ